MSARGTLAAVSTRIVLIGGAQDGREFHAPDDDPIVEEGVVAIPESESPSPAESASDRTAGSTFTLLRYRWDGTARDDGARRYRFEPY
jgi:hypothetical protein